jgi:hypothetical protein
MNYDLYNEINAVQSLKPAARTSTANGTSADLQGYESVLIEINAGSWTDGTHVFEVQESDDDSAFTAVDSSELQGDEPTVDGAADDDQIYKLGYQGDARYLRVIVTVSGGPGTGLVAAATIFRGHYYRPPVS